MLVGFVVCGIGVEGTADAGQGVFVRRSWAEAGTAVRPYLLARLTFPAFEAFGF